MGFFSYVLICAVLLWKPTHSLYCLSCTNIDDPHKCNQTISCSISQVCFLEVQGGIYNLGCSDNQHCGGVDGPGIVGRSVNMQQNFGRTLITRQSSSCHECCSTDTCNSELCKHAAPTRCLDDESVDCAKLNTLFHICQTDKQHASLVCPKFCNLCTMVHGGWTAWSTWSSCDVTCGKGAETRLRSCTNPAPANGGRDCVGTNTETKICQRDPCPVHGGWSTWSQWGSCSLTCDFGIQRRDRSCSNPFPSLAGDHCFGESRDDRICTPGACSDGSWSNWSSWGTCSDTCGGGIHSKTRTCSNPKPSLLGKQCEGTPIEVRPCNRQTCPVHKVGFTAYGKTGSRASVLIFPHIIENDGDGYDNSTGKFTCNTPGIYHFSFQISKLYGQYTDLVECFLRKNSNISIGARQDPYVNGGSDNDKSGYSISLSASFHLFKNDLVYVGGCTGIDTVFKDNRSSFTGVLITPDN